MIRPVVPDETCARYLGIEPGEPVLEVTRRTRSGGEPLEWRSTLVRGDRYGFQAEWSGPHGQIVPRMVAG